jgi:hypothetical protein
MENIEFLTKSFTKLLNSGLIKSIYPMVDHITITKFKENPNFIAYDMNIDIFLNDSTITKDNMYRKEFDPHYLAEKYVKNLANYLGTQIIRVGFKLFGPNGELLLNWDNL